MRLSQTVRGILRGKRTAALTLLALMPIMATAVAREAFAQTSGPSQIDVQAVYLFDFAKFVRWPEGADQGPLTICVAGQRVYTDTLTRLVKGERIDSRPLAVRAITTPEDETGCEIVFIGTSAKDNVDGLLAAAAGKPMLTVSDVPGFLERGGMIQFLIIGNRVRFSVDMRPAVRSGIGLSSELLKVAMNVNGKDASGGGR